VKVKGNLSCVRDFGVDIVSVMSDPYCETEGFGAKVEFVDQGTPRCFDPPLKDSTHLGHLKRPDPLHSKRMLNTIKTVRAYKNEVKGECPILGWVEGPAAEAANLRGVSQFLIDLLENPSFAGELMDLCVEVGLEYAREQVRAGADTIGIGDAIASQVSPSLYGNLIQPREKILMAGIKAMGVYVRLHICGNIAHLLPAIADLPIHILDVDHMVDMETVRRHVGARVALAGNIDPVEGVLRGRPEEIGPFMRRLYDQVGNPFLVNAGCEVPSKTPAENLKALCEPIPYQ
jgi:MtaA/CmuA family methyltransferase